MVCPGGGKFGVFADAGDCDEITMCEFSLSSMYEKGISESTVALKWSYFLLWGNSLSKLCGICITSSKDQNTSTTCAKVHCSWYTAAHDLLGMGCNYDIHTLLFMEIMMLLGRFNYKYD